MTFKIIEEIIKINENEVYYPICGICIGFKLLAAYLAKDFNLLTSIKVSRDY